VAFCHTVRVGSVVAKPYLQEGSRHWWMLLRGLLLLGATIGWSAARSQGQDGLMHSGNGSAHAVGAGPVGVVHGTWFATCHTGVIAINITTMRVTEVPILQPFVGIGRTNVLLLTTTHIAVIHGLVLWETMVVALTTTVALVVVHERALLLSGGIAAAWGLLAKIHAELDVRKLGLHCNQAVGLALHCFLHGCECGTKVCKQVIVRGNQSIIIHGGHFCYHVARLGLQSD
jgi:hypothetical protein